MESPQCKRGALFIVYDEWGGFFDHVVPPRVPDLRSSGDLNKDFGQMGFRIPAVVVSPYARRGHVDHSIYGFESILKMIRYRYGLPPLTPRDLYANNIAAAFDFESAPTSRRRRCPSPPAGHLLGLQRLDPGRQRRGRDRRRHDRLAAPVPHRCRRPALVGLERSAARRAAERPKPHDLQNLVTSGYPRAAAASTTGRPRAATMYRHPSKLGHAAVRRARVGRWRLLAAPCVLAALAAAARRPTASRRSR